jgi:uncharacterized protein DUF6882
VPLETKLQQLAEELQPDIDKMLDRQTERVAGYDDLDFDMAENKVIYRKHGTVVWSAHAVRVGKLNVQSNLFRWWWHGQGGRPTVKSRLDKVIEEGRRQAIGELVTDHVRVDNDEDAELLVNVAVILATADGVLRVDDGSTANFYALFERAPSPSLHPTASRAPTISEQAGPKAAPRASAPPVNPAVAELPVAAATQRPVGVPQQASSSPSPSATGGGRQAPFRTVPVPPIPDQYALPKVPIAAITQRPSPQEYSGARAPSVPETSPFVPASIANQNAHEYMPSSAPNLAESLRVDDDTIQTASPAASGPSSSRIPAAQDHSGTRPSASPAPLMSGLRAASAPSREIFMPTAQLALGIVAGTMREGFEQALLIVSAEAHEGKARFSVVLVASDARGELHALDTPRELVDAAARMIVDDARAGNPRWHKLIARLRPRGGGIDVDVKS